MALKGEAKKEYQRDYMRKRRGSNIGSNRSNAKDELHQTIKSIEDRGLPEWDGKTPLYNPVVHGPGDRVMVKYGNKLVETVIPELDAGGQPVPNYD